MTRPARPRLLEALPCRATSTPVGWIMLVEVPARTRVRPAKGPDLSRANAEVALHVVKPRS